MKKRSLTLLALSTTLLLAACVSGEEKSSAPEPSSVPVSSAVVAESSIAPSSSSAKEESSSLAASSSKASSSSSAAPSSSSAAPSSSSSAPASSSGVAASSASAPVSSASAPVSSSEQPVSSSTPVSSSSVEPIAPKYSVSVTTASVQGYTVNFVGEKTEYEAGDVVTFTLTANYDFYYLDDNSVYYKAEGEETRSTIRGLNGEYNFLMPAKNVIVYVVPLRMYGVKTATTNASVSIQDAKTYYKRFDTVNFTVTPDKDYEVKSVTVTYKEVGAESASTATTSVSEKDGVYSFLMPNGEATITVVAEKIPVAAAGDPWSKETKYVGSYETYHYGSYEIEYTFTFHGNGTVSWTNTYATQEDDGGWGDEWTCTGSPIIKTPTTLYAYGSKTEIKSEGPTKYTYDAEAKTVSFEASGQYAASKVTLTLAATFTGSDPVPTSLKIDKDLTPGEYRYLTANLMLYRQ